MVQDIIFQPTGYEWFRFFIESIKNWRFKMKRSLKENYFLIEPLVFHGCCARRGRLKTDSRAQAGRLRLGLEIKTRRLLCHQRCSLKAQQRCEANIIHSHRQSSTAGGLLVPGL